MLPFVKNPGDCGFKIGQKTLVLPEFWNEGAYDSLEEDLDTDMTSAADGGKVTPATEVGGEGEATPAAEGEPTPAAGGDPAEEAKPSETASEGSGDGAAPPAEAAE